MTEIIVGFKVLLELISFSKELGKFLKAQLGDNPEKFIRDANDVFKQLNASKTSEEKTDAAKKIQDLISRLG
jgi:arsenate reductase-like glutaredoxin family protein